MRQQTRDLIALVKEFNQLKAELFRDGPFVVPDPSNENWKRYDQLYSLLYLGKGKGIKETLGETDCMRCEETFEGEGEFCPKCVRNPNRLDIGETKPVAIVPANPKTPATSRQLWALFCATKKDYRTSGISYEEAARLLEEANKNRWTTDRVLSIIGEAREAGRKAGALKLEELRKAGPKWAIVENKRGDFFSDPSKPERIIDTMLDVCGFANICLEARGSFYLIARKLSEDRTKGYRFSCHKAYYGGGSLSIFDMTMRQEMSVNVAANEAAAKVLSSYGVKITRIDSRID